MNQFWADLDFYLTFCSNWAGDRFKDLRLGLFAVNIASSPSS